MLALREDADSTNHQKPALPAALGHLVLAASLVRLARGALLGGAFRSFSYFFFSTPFWERSQSQLTHVFGKACNHQPVCISSFEINIFSVTSEETHKLTESNSKILA